MGEILYYNITAQKEEEGSEEKQWKCLPENLENFKKKLKKDGYMFDIQPVRYED